MLYSRTLHCDHPRIETTVPQHYDQFAPVSMLLPPPHNTCHTRNSEFRFTATGLWSHPPKRRPTHLHYTGIPDFAVYCLWKQQPHECEWNHKKLEPSKQTELSLEQKIKVIQTIAGQRHWQLVEKFSICKTEVDSALKLQSLRDSFSKRS